MSHLVYMDERCWSVLNGDLYLMLLLHGSKYPDFTQAGLICATWKYAPGGQGILMPDISGMPREAR